MIYYMYYNQDNENITNRHSYELYIKLFIFFS